MPRTIPLRLVRFIFILATGSSVLGACSSRGHEPRQDDATTLRRSTRRARPAAARPLIDLPAALRLSPAVFKTRFGQPQPLAANFVDPSKLLADHTVPADSLAFFQPQGLPMVVSFRPGTGRVQDVLLLGPDEITLMHQATLLSTADDYLLLPVFDSRSTEHLLGLRVVPK